MKQRFNTEAEAKKIALKEVVITPANFKNETDKAVQIQVQLAENLNNLQRKFDDTTLQEYYEVLVRDAEVWVPKSAIQEKDERIAVEMQVGNRTRQIMQPTGRKITVIADWFLQKNNLFIVSVI